MRSTLHDVPNMLFLAVMLGFTVIVRANAATMAVRPSAVPGQAGKGEMVRPHSSG